MKKKNETNKPIIENITGTNAPSTSETQTNEKCDLIERTRKSEMAGVRVAERRTADSKNSVCVCNCTDYSGENL